MLEDVPEWWETFDWDYGSFCDCGEPTCEECMTREAWWAELSPFLLFEGPDGVVHSTRAHDYGALCGNTYYAERAASTDDVRRIAGKALGKHITCLECALITPEPT